MTQLPQFHVKDTIYSVCFGCKKGYCKLNQNHVCNHREEHLAVVKQLCSERDAEGHTTAVEEVEAAVKEESDYMRLMSEHRSLRKEFDEFKKYMMKEVQRARQAVTVSQTPNPFIGMPDDKFDDIDTDKLTDEQLAMYGAEADRRAAEDKARRDAEKARKGVEPKATPLVPAEAEQNVVVESLPATVVESACGEATAAAAEAVEAVEPAAEAVEEAPEAEEEDDLAPPGTAMKLATEWMQSVYSKPVRRAPRPEDIDPELHAQLLAAADAQRRLDAQKATLSNAAGGGPRFAPRLAQQPSVQVSYGTASLVTNTRKKIAPKRLLQPTPQAVLDSYDGRVDESQLTSEEVALWRAEQARIARLAAMQTAF